jgi:hypothetical protein
MGRFVLSLIAVVSSAFPLHARPIDVDGDGIPDLIRASLDLTPTELRGELSGGGSFRTRGWVSDGATDLFGYAVTGIGDVNGDGWNELVVGAPLAPVPGAAGNRGEARLVDARSGDVLRSIGPLPDAVAGELFGTGFGQNHASHVLGGRVWIESRFSDASGSVRARWSQWDVVSGELIRSTPHSAAVAVGVVGDIDGDGAVTMKDVVALSDAGLPIDEVLDLAAGLTIDVASPQVAVIALPGVGGAWELLRGCNCQGICDGGPTDCIGTEHASPGGAEAGPVDGASPGGTAQPGGLTTSQTPLEPPCGLRFKVNGEESPTRRYACIDPSAGPAGCLDLRIELGSPGGTCAGIERWSVTGAEVLSQDGASLNIRVCDAGAVSVTVTVPRGCCDSGGTGRLVLHAMKADLDIDSDNTAQYEPPERTQAEEDVEDIEGEDATPGKVVLCSTFDSDRDGIPDYADGFDSVGAGVTIDDQSAGQFVPLVVEVAGAGRDAIVRFRYGASDPSSVVPTLDEPFSIESEGSLRLWRIDADEPRNQESFVPSMRSYAVRDLCGSGPATLFVEAVRPSVTTAEATIEVEVDPDGPLGSEGWQCADRVRITAVRVMLEGRNFTDQDRSRVTGLIASELNALDGTPLPSVAHGSMAAYSVVVTDPRDLGSAARNQLRIQDAQLPLDPAPGGNWLSPEFYVVSELAHPGTHDGHPVVFARQEILPVSYNPFWDWLFKPGVKEAPAHLKQLCSVIEAETARMRATRWVPPDPRNAGAFGSHVHQHAASTLDGVDGWRADVWVERSTNVVRGFGPSCPQGFRPSQLTQVDLMKLDDGYRIAVGEVIDQSRVTDLFDIKTSATGIGMQPDQLQRLKNVIGGRDVQLTTPLHRWTPGLGWHDNPRATLRRKAMAAVGGAARAAANTITPIAVAYAMFNLSSYDSELTDIEVLIDRMQRERGDLDRRLIAIEAMTSMNRYLRHFLPDDTVSDVIDVAVVYAIMGR